MERIEEINTTRQIVHRYCDDCGKELNWSLQCSKAVCEYCGKMLCEDCIGYEQETGGDYRIVYCKSCSKIYMKYKPQIDETYKEYQRIIKLIQTECKETRRYCL